MLTDSIADLLTRIRNGQRARHHTVRVRRSTMVREILKVLKGEGFIDSFENRKSEGGEFEEFEVALKYVSTGEPVISRMARVSKPGRRVYCGVEELPRVENGLGIVLVSTSQGVMSDREARKRKVGGEVLALVC